MLAGCGGWGRVRELQEEIKCSWSSCLQLALVAIDTHVPSSVSVGWVLAQEEESELLGCKEDHGGITLVHLYSGGNRAALLHLPLPPYSVFAMCRKSRRSYASYKLKGRQLRSGSPLNTSHSPCGEHSGDCGDPRKHCHTLPPW